MLKLTSLKYKQTHLARLYDIINNILQTVLNLASELILWALIDVHLFTV